MDLLRGTLTETTPHPHPQLLQPGKIVATCMNHLRTEGHGKEHRTKKLPPMGKICQRPKGERRPQSSPDQLSPQLGCDPSEGRGLAWGKRSPHSTGSSGNTLETPRTSNPEPVFVELGRQLSILSPVLGPQIQNMLPIFQIVCGCVHAC